MAPDHDMMRPGASGGLGVSRSHSASNDVRGPEAGSGVRHNIQYTIYRYTPHTIMYTDTDVHLILYIRTQYTEIQKYPSYNHTPGLKIKKYRNTEIPLIQS